MSWHFPDLKGGPHFHLSLSFWWVWLLVKYPYHLTEHDVLSKKSQIFILRKLKIKIISEWKLDNMNIVHVQSYGHGLFLCLDLVFLSWSQNTAVFFGPFLLKTGYLHPILYYWISYAKSVFPIANFSWICRNHYLHERS